MGEQLGGGRGCGCSRSSRTFLLFPRCHLRHPLRNGENGVPLGSGGGAPGPHSDQPSRSAWDSLGVGT